MARLHFLQRKGEDDDDDDGDDSLEHACLVVLKMIALVTPVLGSPLLSSYTLKNDVAEFTTD